MDKIMSLARKCMKQVIIILHEVSQVQKDKGQNFHMQNDECNCGTVQERRRGRKYVKRLMNINNMKVNLV
jgi:ABC-type Mn2+/Zn2+ transport system ATPase subunit